jgi:aspartyl-tRNA synthetase
MLSGYDRYFRSPGASGTRICAPTGSRNLTQIDLEMSFVDENDVMGVKRRIYKKAFQGSAGRGRRSALFPRLPYREAMARYGSDKTGHPFALELSDVTDIVRDSASRSSTTPRRLRDFPSAASTPVALRKKFPARKSTPLP